MTESGQSLTHVQTVAAYYSMQGAEQQYRNWGGYNNMPGIYSLHLGFYPTGDPAKLSQKAAILEMDRRIISKLGVENNYPDRIIDLGCGSGANVIQIAQKSPRVEVYGATIAPNQAQSAVQYIRGLRLPNAHILLQNFGHLGFRDGFFEKKTKDCFPCRGRDY